MIKDYDLVYWIAFFNSHNELVYQLCRMVNGLIKTAQGVPPSVATTTPITLQDQSAMKLKAIRCLVEIIKSMGDWMDRQLHIDPNLRHPKKSDELVLEDIDSESDNCVDRTEGLEPHSDITNGISEAESLEQRRAYKLEIQVDKRNCRFINFL